MLVRILVSIFVFSFTVTVAAADLAREKRIAEQIVDAILDGDPVTLSAGDHEFLGVYTEAEEAKGAVLVMHGRGQHPDWADPISPLRVGLTEHGWTTLSIQMPVLAADAKYYDYVPIFPAATPRIEAGIAYLREQGHQRVVLMPHSCAAHMFQDWIQQPKRAAVDATVVISMGATDYKQPMLVPLMLDQLAMPVLDVYAEKDYPSVTRKAEARLAQISAAGNELSKQVVIPGADHYYQGHAGALVETIAGWLNHLAGQ